MANKPKSTKTAERDRRAKVEQLRREQAAKERRKSVIFIVIAVLAGLGLIAAATIPAYLNRKNDPANKSLDSFGVSAAAAQCSDVETQEVPDPPNNMPNWHIQEGERGEYDGVPPSFGLHWPAPVFPARTFYTADDRPAIEQLVHNLEHGYTIVWYDDTISADQRQELEDLGNSARETDAVGPGKKFIVSAWDDSYGDFPEGKHIAMAHWGTQTAHRQLCGQVSGEAVQSFINQFPSTDAPEPNAA